MPRKVPALNPMQIFQVSEAARTILNSPEYQTSFFRRLLAGEIPQMEVMLWHYAWGRPPKEVVIRDTTKTFAEKLAEYQERLRLQREQQERLSAEHNGDVFDPR